MIEIITSFFLFISIIFIFIISIRELHSIYYSFPDEAEINFKHLLIPNIDLETLSPPDILNEINSYREIKNPKYPVSDLSIDEIEKNYKCISILNIFSEKENSKLFFSRLFLDFNIYLIRNRSTILEINILENKIKDFLNNKKITINNKIKGYFSFILLAQFLIYSSFLFFSEYNILEINAKLILYLGLNLIILTLLLFVLSNFFYFGKIFNILRDKTENILFKVDNYFLPVYTNDVSTEIRLLSSSLDSFNLTFKENLVRLEKLISVQEKNYRAQESNFDLLKTLHPEKILETSVRILSDLSMGIKSLDTFSSDIKSFGQSLKSSTRFLEIIETILDKTTEAELNLKKLATGITLRLEESGKLLEFLGSHLSTLEHRKEDMNSIIISTDNALKESYRELANSEQEILHKFQEMTEISIDEYKKVMNHFLKETSEVSRGILSGLRDLESTVGKISTIENNLSHPHNYSLEEYFSRLESSISTTHMKMMEREDKILSAFLQKKEPDSFLSTVQIESPKSVETELNKLLTQININQIYFENVLKEILKELRMESKQKKNLSEISYWKLTIAKWKKFRGEI